MKRQVLLGSLVALCASGPVLADSATLILEAEVRDSCRVTLKGVDNGAVSLNLSDEAGVQQNVGIGLEVSCQGRRGFQLSVSSDESPDGQREHFQLTSGQSVGTPIAYGVVVRSGADELVDTDAGIFSGNSNGLRSVESEEDLPGDADGERLDVSINIDEGDLNSAGSGKYSDQVIFTVDALAVDN